MAWNLWEAFQGGRNTTLTKQAQDSENMRNEALMNIQKLQMNETNRHNMKTEDLTNTELTDNRNYRNKSLQQNADQFGKDFDLRDKVYELSKDNQKFNQDNSFASPDAVSVAIKKFGLELNPNSKIQASQLQALIGDAVDQGRTNLGYAQLNQNENYHKTEISQRNELNNEITDFTQELGNSGAYGLDYIKQNSKADHWWQGNPAGDDLMHNQNLVAGQIAAANLISEQLQGKGKYKNLSPTIMLNHPTVRNWIMNNREAMRHILSNNGLYQVPANVAQNIQFLLGNLENSSSQEDGQDQTQTTGAVKNQKQMK